ncbi:MAG: peptidoglycan-binding protein [Clostridiales bacterium]|jgi:BH1295 protein|nr:peptidoglycan-binding protein [Clostridiales bacterium]
MSVEGTRERIVLIGNCYLGYREGRNNDNIFGDWYGIPNQPWCAMFVSYCMNKAGVLPNVVKKFASCSIGWNWFKSKGQTRNRGYIPQKGDIIFFDWNPEKGDGIDHVGIVNNVNGEYIYTLEGNHDDQVNIYKYHINDARIYGYAVPDYTGEEIIENNPSESYTNKPLVYKGKTGETVKYIQNKLINKGYFLGRTGADGIFGFQTEKAVRQFQIDSNLSADGIIGPLTWEKLEDPTIVISSSYPGNIIGMGARGDNVLKIQRELIRRGYNVPGGADGQYGSGCRETVKKFQGDNGLEIDGVVGKRTWDTLFPTLGIELPYPGKIITMGSRGENVIRIQKRLIRLGYNVPGGADGQYGSGCREMIKKFQGDNGLEIDGDVGENTWNTLFPLQNQKENSEWPRYYIAKGMSDGNVSIIQTRLSNLGYSIGPIDGIFGENTEEAIKNFQETNHLDVDGIVGRDTWNALFNYKEENKSKNDVRIREELKCQMRAELVPYLKGIMTPWQKAKAVREREDAYDDLIKNDEIITKYSNLFEVRKALIQTIILWEHGVEGADDRASDKAVIGYYTLGFGPKNDSSTGICQIYARTAIKAYNYAVKNGLISEKILLDENEENLKNMWYQLYSDVDFNIKMGTLNLLYCDWQKNSSYKSYKYDTDESNIKRILERYNGEGKDAIEYAERNYGLYKIFEKYNEAMRAIS